MNYINCLNKNFHVSSLHFFLFNIVKKNVSNVLNFVVNKWNRYTHCMVIGHFFFGWAENFSAPPHNAIDRICFLKPFFLTWGDISALTEVIYDADKM